LKKRVEPRLGFERSVLPLHEWRQQLRLELTARLGLSVPTTPLRAERLWQRDEPDGHIERWDIEVDDGALMPAYLAVPHTVEGPIPFIICLQGHSTGMHVALAFDREDEQTPIAVAGDRDLARQCLANGVGALCIEQRAFGLRRDPWSEQHSSYPLCNDAAMHALALGRTLLGERIADVARAVQFLRAQPHADATRIGVMGNSAGGTASLYSIALVDGLAFAVPSSCFCQYSESWARASFCPCGYVPGLMQLADLPDILGLAAPKPVMVIVGREDRGFPTESVEAAFGQLKAIYAAAGAPDACRLALGPEGHRFYADLAWPWIREVLGA